MLTLEQHLKIYEALEAETSKARREVYKAKKAYDNMDGMSFERELAANILRLRESQHKEARDAVSEYWDFFIADPI